MSKTALLIGASRGIGLALIGALHSAGYAVLATCRRATDELRAAGAEQLIEGIDVGDDAVGARLTAALPAGRALDLVLHNAGVLESDASIEALRRQFEVNTLGPVRVARAVLPLLKAGSKLAFVTTRVASIADAGSSSNIGYRMSKTALNMYAHTLALDVKKQEIAVALIHPGYVITDMTGQSGDITAEESARGIVTQVLKMTLENSGSFVHGRTGEVIPW